ncbi:MAG: superinfection exclusion protein [Pseudomonadota bacterium]
MSREFKVWWVPQIPMEAFEWSVPDYAAGVALCDALAEYDAFQLRHRVKPDYCNAGGVQWRDSDATGGEWEDLEPDEAEDLGLISDADA